MAIDTTDRDKLAVLKVVILTFDIMTLAHVNFDMLETEFNAVD